MIDQEAWNAAPHDHCDCGARLVAQPYEGTEPVCLDCGYFSHECTCEPSACESCGREA